MVKLICPLAACCETDFGTTKPNQTHINQHLLTAHNVRITHRNQIHCRREQNKAWEEACQRLEAKRTELSQRDYEGWKRFSNDAAHLDIPRSSFTDAWLRTYSGIIDVKDDGYDAEIKHRVSEAIGSAVLDEVQGRRSELDKKKAEWFLAGPVGRGYAVSVRYSQVEGYRQRSLEKSRERMAKMVQEFQERGAGDGEGEAPVVNGGGLADAGVEQEVNGKAGGDRGCEMDVDEGRVNGHAD